MKIPFSPPFIDPDIEKEVMETLRSGWITTGPKVRELERLCNDLSGVSHTVCVNSWTSGAMLVLKWLGITTGDEVIIPAYTYSATALAVLHCGAKPVMVDVADDFLIDPDKAASAVTPRTKAVIAVDFAGWPCNYDILRHVVDDSSKFQPSNDVQRQFGRIALLSDAAHSLGAIYNNNPSALAADITIYSFHAVKNVTTAEGGAICLNLPQSFDNSAVYNWMKLNSLNGQTKDAFTKTTTGDWRYDVISPGLKINMPDICAAIGVGQLKKYTSALLPARERVFNHYKRFFDNKDWAQLPAIREVDKPSYHLFPLRFKNISENQRNKIIDLISSMAVSVNVHFVPLPMLTLFDSLGYDIKDYPVAYDNYKREISLPIYPQLTDEDCVRVEEAVEKAYLKVV